MANGAVKFLSGPRGEIWLFVRSGRIPGREFIESVPEVLFKRFERSWQRFAREGMGSASHDSFKPMGNGGKGLWCFKEHDHRLFATQVPYPSGAPTRLAILSGWVKDKSISREEEREVHKAQQLRGECLALNWLTIREWNPDPIEAEPQVPAPAPACEAAEEPKADEEDSKAGEYVKIQALASLIGVHRTTLTNWIKNGSFPAPTIDLGAGPNGGKAWPWSKLDDLAEIAEKMVAVKKPAAVPVPVVPEAPGADERIEAPAFAGPSAPPMPAIEPSVPEAPVLTRSELMKLFTRWVDGGEEPDLSDLRKSVGRYRERVDALLVAQKAAERELEQLLGES